VNGLCTLAAPTPGSEAAVCQGESIHLTASTVAGATYSWTGPNGFTSTAQSPTISNAQPAATGTYSVTATVGTCTSTAVTTATTVTADSTPPGVAPPGNIVVDQTVCCGTFGGVLASDAAVAAFLTGATADLGGCVTSPTQLAPQIGVADVVPGTCFEAGETIVTFRFQDAVPNIGMATAKVTVRMFGDVNLTNTITISDALLMRDYFLGFIISGTPPFPTLGDVNHSGDITINDVLRLRDYILGPIATCLAP
jgi:hypothetical protein